jgi:hypothetical protein
VRIASILIVALALLSNSVAASMHDCAETTGATNAVTAQLLADLGSAPDSSEQDHCDICLHGVTTAINMQALAAEFLRVAVGAPPIVRNASRPDAPLARLDEPPR